MVSLSSNRNWKEFFLEDVVSIENGKRLTKSEMQIGNIPFIGASELNNGITSFTSTINESADSNVLGVNYTLLFLSAMISQQKIKYAYGYKFNTTRMKRQKILLPITKDNAIDWAFMEAYMKQKEQEILELTIEKLCNYLISNEILGGVNLYILIGKNSFWEKSFQFRPQTAA